MIAKEWWGNKKKENIKLMKTTVHEKRNFRMIICDMQLKKNDFLMFNGHFEKYGITWTEDLI